MRLRSDCENCCTKKRKKLKRRFTLCKSCPTNLEKNVQISAIHDPPPKRTVGCAVGRSLPLVQCGPARTSRCVETASFYQLLHASESTERDSCCWRPRVGEFLVLPRHPSPCEQNI